MWVGIALALRYAPIIFVGVGVGVFVGVGVVGEVLLGHDAVEKTKYPAVPMLH